MRLERLQIDEQLRQIGVGYRGAPNRSGAPGAGDRERGYQTDESSNSLQTSRTYGGRGRGRKSNNAYSGYGEPTVHDLFHYCFVHFEDTDGKGWNI